MQCPENTHKPFEHFKEYYIVFTETNLKNRLYKWLFTRDGFGHCFIMQDTIEGVTVANVNLFGGDIGHIPAITAKELANRFAIKYAVVYLPMVQPNKVQWRLGAFVPSCVGFCQRIIGKPCYAITPWGFYKALIKSGGFLVGFAKKPDNSALIKAQDEQRQELERQRKERDKAEIAAREREEAEKRKQADITRRMRLGRRSLLGTEGGELGVSG